MAPGEGEEGGAEEGRHAAATLAPAVVPPTPRLGRVQVEEEKEEEEVEELVG